MYVMWLVEVAFVMLFAMSWYPCCCNTECSTTCTNCVDDHAPCQWQIEISGYTRFGGTSCTCEDINATHTTGFSSTAGCNSPGSALSLSGSGCVDVNVYVSVVYESAVYKLRVTVEIEVTGIFGSGYQQDIYEAAYGTKPDCMNFIDEECDYVSTNYIGVYGQRCNPAASVFVTSL